MYDFKRSSLTLMILCFGLFGLAARPVLAQSEREPRAIKQSTSPQSNDCPASQTFIYGRGATFFKFCITDHGNVIDLISPFDRQHNLGYEGYVVCSTGANYAFDGGFDEGNWGAATATQPGGPNTFPLTIKRQSMDGKLELTQTFNSDPAQKEILITMVLKNISAGAITNVKFARYFDDDLDLDGFDDIYDKDSDSVWGHDKGTGGGHHGVMLTALTFIQGHTTAVQNYSDYSYNQADCVVSPVATVPTAPGDYAGRVTYNLGTFNPGVSKTVQFLYRVF